VAFTSPRALRSFPLQFPQNPQRYLDHFWARYLHIQCEHHRKIEGLHVSSRPTTVNAQCCGAQTDILKQFFCRIDRDRNFNANNTVPVPPRWNRTDPRL